MQMYVLAALLGATSAIKNHMPTDVAATAGPVALAAVTEAPVNTGAPRGTNLCDHAPTDADQKQKQGNPLKCKSGYIWVTKSLTTKECSFQCFVPPPPPTRE